MRLLRLPRWVLSLLRLLLGRRRVLHDLPSGATARVGVSRGSPSPGNLRPRGMGAARFELATFTVSG